MLSSRGAGNRRGPEKKLGDWLLADSLIPAELAPRDLLVLLSAIAGFSLMLLFSRLWLASGINRIRLTPVVLRKNIVGP